MLTYHVTPGPKQLAKDATKRTVSPAKSAREEGDTSAAGQSTGGGTTVSVAQADQAAAAVTSTMADPRATSARATDRRRGRMSRIVMVIPTLQSR